MNILVFGGDERYRRLCEKYGYDNVLLNDNDLKKAEETVKNYDYVLLPIPLTRDGKTVNNSGGFELEKLKNWQNKVIISGAVGHIDDDDFPPIIDICNDKDFAEKNAYLTAVGCVGRMINNLKIPLCGEKILIVGYGKIAQRLAAVLYGFDIDITVAARSEKARGNAALLGLDTVDTNMLDLTGYDIVLNTVPAVMIGENELDEAGRGTMLIELASAPGGYDKSAAERRGINIINMPAIPSDFADKSAEIINDFLREMVENG